MQIEDIEPTQLTLEQMLQDPKKKKKIVKILLQTMRNMGYYQTAKQLQQQSCIPYQSPILIKLKQMIKEQNYLSAIDLIKQFNLSPTKKTNVYDKLYELHFNKLLKDSNIQDAYLFITNQTIAISQRVRQMLIQSLILGPQHIQDLYKKQFQTTIIQQCDQDQIQLNVMSSLLRQYISMKQHPQFYNQQQFLFPPSHQIYCRTFGQQNEKALCIKFNRTGTNLLIISELDHKINLYLCHIDNKKIQISKKNCLQKNPFDFESVSWSWSNQCYDEYIAVCFKRSIVICDQKLAILNEIASEGNERFLCVDWDPTNGLLYVGGLFNNLKIYTVQGQLCMQMFPFVATRQLLITDTLIYALGAVENNLSMFLIGELKEEKIFHREDAFMAFTLQNKKLLITSEKYIYLVDQELNVLFIHPSPFNPNRYKIEGLIFKNWIIVLCDKFKAVSMGNQQQLISQEWEGNGFFDSFGNQFVSAHLGDVILWEQGSVENYQKPLEIQENQSDQEEMIASALEQSDENQSDQEEMIASAQEQSDENQDPMIPPLDHFQFNQFLNNDSDHNESNDS